MATRYYIRLPDGSLARGTTPSLSFTAQGADVFAEQLQDALREPTLFERWRQMQDEPDEVDPSLGEVDPHAVVHGEQHDLHIDLQVTSSISGHVLKQRLRLLAGSAWELRDVTAA
ncbi:hypothetical protein [Lysobacter sp. A3-1-A15]|uniref:hypothetical protein n=1 Tax=Novilysobacter viscosus TaxID=3098602 RepID=UPI002EDB53E5